jgi:hypothetical protein
MPILYCRRLLMQIVVCYCERSLYVKKDSGHVGCNATDGNIETNFDR